MFSLPPTLVYQSSQVSASVTSKGLLGVRSWKRQGEISVRSEEQTPPVLRSLMEIHKSSATLPISSISVLPWEPTNNLRTAHKPWKKIWGASFKEELTLLHDWSYAVAYFYEDGAPLKDWCKF